MHMLRSVRLIPLAAAIVSLAHGTPGVAQTRSDSSDLLKALVGCQKLEADPARLSCFDKAAEQIAAASISGKLLALDREKVIERKRQRFGLVNGAQSPLGGGEADRLTKVTEVRTTIVGVRPASYERFLLQLANDTVWETIEPLSLTPGVGTAIIVRQSRLGGFKAAIDGERPILVKRQR